MRRLSVILPCRTPTHPPGRTLTVHQIARVLDFPALAMECERAAKQAAEQMRLRAEEDVQNVRLEKAKDLDRDVR